MVGVLSLVCLLYSLPGPPHISAQNDRYQLYTVNRKWCPKFDYKRDTIFELYTRKNQNESQILETNNSSSIESSNFDPNSKTIIFFHGFLETSRSDDGLLMKEYHLKLGPYNVILVDMSRLLAGPDYISAALKVEPIGRFSAAFIDFLVTKGLKLSLLHIIGHSLGAQIAGITGKNLKTGKASRITGLDPAGPFFNNKPQNMLIAKGDAEFVDIIHTNAGIFGTTRRDGDIDIWVNGGAFQPGCKFSEIFGRGRASFSEYVFCSHHQSYRLYVMSLINAKEYLVTKCDSYQDYVAGNCSQNPKTFLGVNVDRQASGDYYITTGVTAFNLKAT